MPQTAFLYKSKVKCFRMTEKSAREEMEGWVEQVQQEGYALESVVQSSTNHYSYALVTVRRTFAEEITVFLDPDDLENKGLAKLTKEEKEELRQQLAVCGVSEGLWKLLTGEI